MIPRFVQPSPATHARIGLADFGVNGGIFDRSFDDMRAARLELRLDQRDKPGPFGGERQRRAAGRGAGR